MKRDFSGLAFFSYCNAGEGRDKRRLSESCGAGLQDCCCGCVPEASSQEALLVSCGVSSNIECSEVLKVYTNSKAKAEIANWVGELGHSTSQLTQLLFVAYIRSVTATIVKMESRRVAGRTALSSVAIAVKGVMADLQCSVALRDLWLQEHNQNPENNFGSRMILFNSVQCLLKAGSASDRSTCRSGGCLGKAAVFMWSGT